MQEVYQALARRMECPQALRPELELVVLLAGRAVRSLLRGRRLGGIRASGAGFRVGSSDAVGILEDLFRRGLLAPRQPTGAAEPAFEYDASEFYPLLLRQLGEGRLGHVAQASFDRLREYCFGKRLDLTDRLLEQGQLTASSEVFPVEQALTGHQHPHPGETTVMAGVDARRLVAEVSAVQLLPCTCRMTYQRCDKPLETCLILGAYAEEYRARGVGKAVSPPAGPVGCARPPG